MLSRGQRYCKDGRVKNLVTCPEGLLANVEGTESYITLVGFEKDETDFPSFNCTCPYERGCKHAVAVILRYCQLIKTGKSVPRAKPKDPRLKLLRNGNRKDALEDEFEELLHTESKTSPKDISEYLTKQSKGSLVEMVTQLSKTHGDVKQELLDRTRFSAGKTKQIVLSVRREISSIMSKPAWQNHWSNEGHLADFSRVEKNMRRLLNQRHFDALIDITKFLLKKGIKYIETCDDDGDSEVQVAHCLEIGFEGVKHSTWSDYDKLVFAVNALLEEGYGLCDGAYGVIDAINDKSAWSKLADLLQSKLKRARKPFGDKFQLSERYDRDQLSNHLIEALERSDRSDEIVPLMKREAKITGSWERLVNHLIKLKKPKEAKKAAKEGVQAVGEKRPGITKALREKIAKLSAKDGNFNENLLLRQEDFLETPSLTFYDDLMKAAKKTKNQNEMKDWAISFLTTGKAPAKGALRRAFRPERSLHHSYPEYEILIDIAEKEKRVDDVWALYQKAKKREYFQSSAQVANAIQNKYPEEAIKIWCALTESEIAKTTPASYTIAVGYLKKVMRRYIALKRKKEWSAYLAGLREAHKRKPRFIRELARLTEEKLL